MLKTRDLFFGLAFVVALISDSQGRSRHHIPDQTPKTQQTASPDQRGSADQPLTVNVVPTTEQKSDAEQSRNAAAIKAVQDEKIVSYTSKQVIIGFFQIGIFILQLIAFGVQACYMRRSANEMRRTTHATIRATRAAQKSADAAAVQATIAESALTQLERPYIFVFGVRWIREDEDKDLNEFFVEYTVVNYGKMPAIIDGAWIDFVLDNKGEPTIPTRLYDGHSLLMSPILQSGERRENIRAYVPSGMANGSLGVIVNVKGGPLATCPNFDIPDGFDLYFLATIQYRGPSSSGHETSALWLYYPGSCEFAQRGGGEYNYTK